MLGGCQWPNCTVSKPELLDFVHLEDTPLVVKTRAKAQAAGKRIGRGRSARYFDIMKYPDRYSLLCNYMAEDHHHLFDDVGPPMPSWRPRSLLEIAEGGVLVIFPKLVKHRVGDPIEVPA
jgi:hypothetical protein